MLVSTGIYTADSYKPDKIMFCHHFHVPGKQYVLLSSISAAANLSRELAELLFMGPSLSFASLSEKPEKYKTTHNLEVSDGETAR